MGKKYQIDFNRISWYNCKEPFRAEMIPEQRALSWFFTYTNPLEMIKFIKSENTEEWKTKEDLYWDEVEAYLKAIKTNRNHILNMSICKSRLPK